MKYKLTLIALLVPAFVFAQEGAEAGAGARAGATAPKDVSTVQSGIGGLQGHTGGAAATTTTNNIYGGGASTGTVAVQGGSNAYNTGATYTVVEANGTTRVVSNAGNTAGAGIENIGNQAGGGIVSVGNSAGNEISTGGGLW